MIIWFEVVALVLLQPVCILSFVWSILRLWSEQAEDVLLASHQKMFFWLCLKDRANFRFPKKPAIESLGHCCLAGSTKVDLQPLQYQRHPYWLRTTRGDLNGTLSAKGIMSPLKWVSLKNLKRYFPGIIACLKKKFTYIHLRIY